MNMGNQKAKDFQPPYEEEREGFSAGEAAEGLDRPGRSEIKDITDEASHRDADGVLRQTLRGDETKGDPNERDVAGSTKFEDTPHGREETKKDKSGAANQNG
jgi:hypothetical protein